MAVSVLALGARLVPPTLNYRRPDPECPIHVIHGEPLASPRLALLLNRTAAGQAVAVVLAAVLRLPAAEATGVHTPQRRNAGSH